MPSLGFFNARANPNLVAGFISDTIKLNGDAKNPEQRSAPLKALDQQSRPKAGHTVPSAREAREVQSYELAPRQLVDPVPQLALLDDTQVLFPDLLKIQPTPSSTTTALSAGTMSARDVPPSSFYPDNISDTIEANKSRDNLVQSDMIFTIIFGSIFLVVLLVIFCPRFAKFLEELYWGIAEELGELYCRIAQRLKRLCCSIEHWCSHPRQRWRDQDIYWEDSTNSSTAATAGRGSSIELSERGEGIIASSASTASKESPPPPPYQAPHDPAPQLPVPQFPPPIALPPRCRNVFVEAAALNADPGAFDRAAYINGCRKGTAPRTRTVRFEDNV